MPSGFVEAPNDFWEARRKGMLDTNSLLYPLKWGLGKLMFRVLCCPSFCMNFYHASKLLTHMGTYLNNDRREQWCMLTYYTCLKHGERGNVLHLWSSDHSNRHLHHVSLAEWGGKPHYLSSVKATLHCTVAIILFILLL